MNSYNGRENLYINKSNKYQLYKENNNVNNQYSYNALSNVYEINSLQLKFFSSYNIEKLQHLIRYNVFIQSNKKHNISRQDDTILKIIMKSIYLQFSKNLNNDISKQVTELNNLVLDYCISNILSNIEMYLVYKKDVSNLPLPIEHPKYISDSGTRTNNNLIK